MKPSVNNIMAILGADAAGTIPDGPASATGAKASCSAPLTALEAPTLAGCGSRAGLADGRFENFFFAAGTTSVTVACSLLGAGV